MGQADDFPVPRVISARRGGIRVPWYLLAMMFVITYQWWLYFAPADLKYRVYYYFRYLPWFLQYAEWYLKKELKRRA